MRTPFRGVIATSLAAASLVLFVMAACSGPSKQPVVSNQPEEHKSGSNSTHTLIGMQYETFFTPHNVSWDARVPSGSVGLSSGTAEAIPVLGKYSSFDTKVIRKHEEWFEYLGIDWLLIDWTNFLIAKTPWERHADATGEAERTSELLFQTYRQLQKEGKHPPKLVFMMPPFKSDPNPVTGIPRLNAVIQWATAKFLQNPEYKDLLLQVDGKPLLMVTWWGARVGTEGRTCADLAKFTDQVVAPGWTVRWMGTQLQNSHVNECGYWSWMDGTIRQVVTEKDGAPEETVVTPACFPFAFSDALLKSNRGWLDPKATGRDHGAPYIESWKVAFENRPKFIQIHQWNEFAGQPNGQGMGAGLKRDVYGDEYSLEFSDDVEPTRLNACGYRNCGGWGFYYVNLTKALISLYRNEAPGITVLALSGPAASTRVNNPHLDLSWNYLGKTPSSFTLKVDGREVAGNMQGSKYTLDLSGFAAGRHTVLLVANGAETFFDLAPDKLTAKSQTQLPVTSTLEFNYWPR